MCNYVVCFKHFDAQLQHPILVPSGKHTIWKRHAAKRQGTTNLASLAGQAARDRTGWGL